jgi:hypothetical protein
MEPIEVTLKPGWLLRDVRKAAARMEPGWNQLSQRRHPIPQPLPASPTTSSSTKPTKTHSPLEETAIMPKTTGSKTASASKFQSQPCDRLEIHRESENRWIIEWFKEGVCTIAHRCNWDEAGERFLISLRQMEPMPNDQP